MSLHHSSTRSVEHPGVGNGSETHLQGIWLVLARIGWVTFTLLALGLFIASSPSYFAYLHIINPTFPGGPQLSFSDVRALQTHGFSLDFYAWFTIGMNATIWLVYLFVGVVLFWRKSDDRVALLASLSLVLFPTQLNTPVLGPIAWIVPTEGVQFLGTLCLGLFLCVFPNGRFVPRWTSFLMIGWTVWWAIAIFFPTVPPRFPLFALPGFGLAASLIASQVYRYRRVSTPVQRQQTKWAIFGIILSFGSYALDFTLLYAVLTVVFHRYLSPLDHVLGLLPANLLLLLFPLFIGIAILRYRLWDIDIIIHRALVYGMLTASVIGLYVLVVVGLGSLIQAQGNVLLSLLATGVIAVLFQPLRQRLQQAINRLLYGERDAPYTVISRLGKRLEATVAPETVLPSIVETVAQALKLPYAAITLKDADAFSLATSYGTVKGELVHLPLVYQTEQVGELLLAPRAPGESFTPADRKLLNDLARQAGVAVHAVQLTHELSCLTQDLQHARERLVSAREEERRRLRRDLHDGLGAALTSVTFQLDAASNVLDRDPQAVKTMLKDLKAQTQASIADIRRLVYELRPPILDEWGLVAALREQVAQYQLHHVQVTIDAPESLSALPAAIEVAAYRIALEALANVVRHAQAATCTMHLSIDDDVLTVEMQDDGKGLPKGYHAGVGITAMRERAAELGGSCTVETLATGGTRVSASLPLVKE